MHPVRRAPLKRRVSVVAALYGALCVAILLEAPFVSSVAAAIPRPLAVIVVIMLGPAALLAAGIGAITWFIAVLTAVAACVGLSWVAWRRYPDSELFAVGLLAAAALWALVPLLLLAAFSA